jgi:hypothetical protein
MRDTIEMAREADLIDDSYASDWYVYQLKAFEALARADEREACAKVCDEARAARLAEQIRARGETK